MQIPYDPSIFRPSNAHVPGNETDENPVVFSLVPAWGPDLARIRSVMFASQNLVHDRDWSPGMQDAVIAAFDTGSAAFVNTVTEISGLTVPAAMALRAGILMELPIGADGKPNPKAQVAVPNGLQFGRLTGALPALALLVAFEISKISAEAERTMDPRFFAQPTGSGETATADQAKATNAATVRPPRESKGTAARKSTKRGK
jgi:hypothetical protein